MCPSGPTKFEARNGYDSYAVDLKARICTCRLWEISGIPCVHAQAAILYNGQDPVDFICRLWFGVDKFKVTYATNLLPVNGSNMWPRTSYTKPLPPLARRMPGRPSVKRRRHVSESSDKYSQVSSKGRSVQCKNCLQTGHNKASCKNPKVTPEPRPKKKMGRPRVDPDISHWIRGGGRGPRGCGRGSRGGGRVSRGDGVAAKEKGKQVMEEMRGNMKMGVSEGSARIEEAAAIDLQGTINDMKNSKYSDEEIRMALGITEEEMEEIFGDNEVVPETQVTMVRLANFLNFMFQCFWYLLFSALF